MSDFQKVLGISLCIRCKNNDPFMVKNFKAIDGSEWTKCRKCGLIFRISNKRLQELQDLALFERRR